MAAAEEGSLGFKRTTVAAEVIGRIAPSPQTFKKYPLRLISEGLEVVVTEKRAREDESEERGDNGSGAGAAVEEVIVVERKRARVEEAPEAPARKEDREVGKLYRVKVRGSDKVELRVWSGKKSDPWGCEHGRQRSQCKECGGASICEHGRQRNYCKECGGASICEHGRQRHKCKECGGGSICEHGRRRIYCKECTDVCV